MSGSEPFAEWRRRRDERLEAARLSLIEAGHRVTADGRVGRDAAATVLGVSKRWLEERAHEPGAPLAILVGGRAQYRLDDLLAWLDHLEAIEAQKITPPSRGAPQTAASRPCDPRSRPVR